MNTSYETIYFDLDKTLFDHAYAMQSAVEAITQVFPGIDDDLRAAVLNYESSMESTYTRYLNGSLSYAQSRLEKVRLFFQIYGLPAGPEQITQFLEVYEATYTAQQRPTAGSIQALTYLERRGFNRGIITNGEELLQTKKIEAIGLTALVQSVITSEAAGCPKPLTQIFTLALSRFNADPAATLMVGDNIDTDIKGALAAGMDALLYAPDAPDTEIAVEGTRVQIIRHMDELQTFLE